MRLIILVQIFFLLFISFHGHAQDQLVLVKGEKVLARFSEEQSIIYKLKKSQDFSFGYIAKVQAFSMIIGLDTVLFSAIDKIKLPNPKSSFVNRLGNAILGAGILYFAADQFNSLIHANGYDNDPAVWKPALILAVSGIALKLIRKRVQRLQFPAKLIIVKQGSPFYKSSQ